MSVEKDVVCGAVAGRDLHVDLYRPEGAGVPTRTAVLIVHGGGWMVGERGSMAPLAQALAAKGFLAVPVEYRLVPEAPWPAALDDVIAAVRWTADNAARLGVDADRIVVAGCSAGAHMALMAAAKLREGPRIAAVISLFAASELTLDPHPAAGRFNAAMLFGPAGSEEAARDASPLHQLTADFPPVCLLHGGGDWLIDPVASVRVYDRLVSLGVTAELHIFARALHEFSAEPGMIEPVAATAALFLSRVLVEPGRWDAESLASNLFAQGPEALQAMMAKMAAGEPVEH